MRTNGPRRRISWLLLAALAGPWSIGDQPTNANAPAEADVTGTSRIEGKVLAGRTPVEGAVVRACYLEGERAYASSATGPGGEYEIVDLPPGYADLTVETREGFFLANQVLSFAPGGRIVADLTLTKHAGEPTAAIPIGERKDSACGAANFLGSAEIGQKTTFGDFLRSPQGIAIVAGGAGAVLLVVASGGGDDTPASASSP